VCLAGNHVERPQVETAGRMNTLAEKQKVLLAEMDSIRAFIGTKEHWNATVDERAARYRRHEQLAAEYFRLERAAQAA
jgi:hypothetical protein